MKSINNIGKAAAAILLGLFLSFPGLASDDNNQIRKISRYFEKQVKDEGFSTETPGQIIKATQCSNWFVRKCALGLLADRTGEDAVPTLKAALADEQIDIRIWSADLLYSLGDTSGLTQMQKDFKELVPRNGAMEPEDPNLVKDSIAYNKWQSKRTYRVKCGLEVAEVLAKIGDRRGFKLAVREALENQFAGNRLRAAKVLTEIAKTDLKVLLAEKCDPIPFLVVMASCEKKNHVYVFVRVMAEKIGGERGLEILRAATENPYQPQEELRWARIGYERLRATIDMEKK